MENVSELISYIGIENKGSSYGLLGFTAFGHNKIARINYKSITGYSVLPCSSKKILELAMRLTLGLAKILLHRDEAQTVSVIHFVSLKRCSFLFINHFVTPRLRPTCIRWTLCSFKIALPYSQYKVYYQFDVTKSQLIGNSSSEFQALTLKNGSFHRVPCQNWRCKASRSKGDVTALLSIIPSINCLDFFPPSFMVMIKSRIIHCSAVYRKSLRSEH